MTKATDGLVLRWVTRERNTNFLTLPALLKLLKIPTLLATLAALAHLSTYLSRAGLAGHASRAGHCSIVCVPLVVTVTLLKKRRGFYRTVQEVLRFILQDTFL